MPSPHEHPVGPNDNDPRENDRNEGQAGNEGLDSDLVGQFDPLLAELRSPNFDYIRLESAVAMFVADCEEGFLGGDPSEHPSLETLSDYLWDSAVEDYIDLAERFKTVRTITEQGILKHASTEDVANDALQRICAVVFTDTASCLTSLVLNNELNRYAEEVQRDHLNPFCSDVTNRVLRIANLKQNSSLPLEMRDAEALKMLSEVESNTQILLRGVSRGEAFMSASYASLIRQGVDQLEVLAPDLSEEYKSLLREQLFDAYQDDFTKKLNEIREEQQEQIKEARALFRDALPPSARPPAP